MEVLSHTCLQNATIFSKLNLHYAAGRWYNNLPIIGEESVLKSDTMKNLNAGNKKRTVLVLFAVLLVLSGIWFFRTTDYGFYSVLKTSFVFFVLAGIYVFLIKGVTGVFRWVKEHRQRVIRILLLEAALLFYMVFFVHKIKNELSLYHSAQVTCGFLVMELILVVFVLTEHRRIPLHRIYLLLGIILGVLYLFLQPVGFVPDEHTHLRASYDVSNTMLGIDRTPGGTIQMRAEDASYPLNTESDRYEFTEYWESLIRPLQYDGLTDTGKQPLDTARYQYFLPAVGLTAARLLHLGAGAAFFLGRLCNLLWFVLITAYAIRCLPFGKTVLTALALSPMSLQQASSFSYDAFLNAAAFLLVAMTLRLVYGDGEANSGAEGRKRHIVHILILLAVCLLILPVKGYAYMPLCFLPVLPAVKTWKTNRREAWLYLAIVLICVIVFVGMRFLPMVQRAEAISSGAVAGGGQKYTLDYLRSMPYEWAYVLFNTSRNQGAFYLESMIGSPLGWLLRPLNTILVYGYVIVLFLASIRRSGESVIMGKYAKIWFHLLAWSSVAFIFLGMLFNYSNVARHTIEGVQGRYFIPLAFMMLLTVRSDGLQVKKEIDGPILTCALTCIFFVVQYLVP